jgi:hypothetical protein
MRQDVLPALIVAVYNHHGIIYLLFTSWLLAFFPDKQPAEEKKTLQ